MGPWWRDSNGRADRLAAEQRGDLGEALDDAGRALDHGDQAAGGPLDGHRPARAELLDLGQRRVGDRQHRRGAQAGAQRPAAVGDALEPAEQHGVELLGEREGLGNRGHDDKDAGALAKFHPIRMDWPFGREPRPSLRSDLTERPYLLFMRATPVSRTKLIAALAAATFAIVTASAHADPMAAG